MRLPKAGDMAKVLIELPDGQTFVTQVRLSRFRIQQHAEMKRGEVLGKPLGSKINVIIEGEIPGYLILEDGELDAIQQRP